MKKMYVIGALLVAILALQSFNSKPYTPETTEDGVERLIDVRITVNGIYRDSLFWFMDTTIRGLGSNGEAVTAQGKVKGSAKALGNHEIQRIRKGAQGKGQLNVPKSGGTGKISIVGLTKQPLTGTVGPKVLNKFR